MKTFYILTLGCKANQYDSEAMAHALESLGLARVTAGIPADLCIVNTCAVTSVADQKSRQLLRKVIRMNPGARVVATGCVADYEPELLRGIAGVSDVVRNAAKPHLPEFLGLAGPMPFEIRQFHNHSRAFLKIEDGCDCSCTYCIIPHVRGKAASRPLAEIDAEARRLLAAGHKEIVLTGIHLGSYGSDFHPPQSLPDAIDLLLNIEAPYRLRLSSIEALEFSDRLVDQVATRPHICPHFHIPLQSGSDRILARMGRRCRRGHIERIVQLLNDRLPDVSYTTDVIVGFPGEMDEDFDQTLDLVKAVGFSRVHVFPYSDRRGTPAARMPGKCSRRTIDDRCHRLVQLANTLAREYKQRFLGKVVRVLTETERDSETGKQVGITDRYIRVLFDGEDRLHGQFTDVRILRVEPEVAYGEQVDI